jgi:hypothetical protein
MYEKFAICCIYDKISAGFYRVQIFRKAYENVIFFSVGAVLASLWIHFYSHESSMEFPWRASYIWIFVRETLANQVYVVATEELWYHKSSLRPGKLWHRHFKVYGLLYEKMRFSTNNSKAQIPWKFHGTLMGVKKNSQWSKNSTNREKCNVFIGFSEDLYSVKSCRNFLINATNSELFIHELNAVDTRWPTTRQQTVENIMKFSSKQKCLPFY